MENAGKSQLIGFPASFQFHLPIAQSNASAAW
jgi:hypothetical protein